ncbi:PAS domain-containing protein [Pseudomassariella vexata]|uniref:PAS domain-domain-containing protein n=1 Tax=Pseudomassariella vexata TaxID=1141098 RepID=A0A1Y2DN94_9PEZI|nr:PAS domain-containing protein [Pseudomassariella vexata]ORY60707.1 PAS domain-domain-containing protein [Pseudomassariella vexata]
MDNFFGTQLSQEELQRRHAQQRAQRRSTNSGMNQPQQQQQMSMNRDTSMVGTETLDDIIRNNHQELQRRRSLPQQAAYGGQMSHMENDRRLSMMDFGSGGNGLDAFRDYQFGGVMTNSPTDGMGGGYPNMNSMNNLTIPGTSASFSPQGMLSADFSALSPEMMGSMIAFSNMNMGQMGSDPSTMSMFQSGMPTGFSQNSTDSMSADFAMEMANNGSQMGSTPMSTAPSDSGTATAMDVGDTDMISTTQRFVSANQSNPPQSNLNLDTAMSNYQPSISPQPQAQMPPQNNLRAVCAYPSPLATTGIMSDNTSLTQPRSNTGSVVGPSPPPKDSKTIYSKSGFDMLRALWQVATRKNPQVNLGAVDMSCAFVVCDVSMNDCPIIYVSDNFQNLTGYSRHDIVGQNCRFLQAPDGKVEAGTKREFVDNGAVFNLKQKIAEGKEVQQSLINYRKGGKPFLNLLTMIPIPWDNPPEIKYFIGFQIDLVECPDAIGSAQGPGTIKVDYKHSDIGQYIWTPPSSTQTEPENGQTLGVDDVSTLLQQFTPKGAVSDWHRQSWDKMLLENADDVVHVLSLKGLFLYLSPSCKRVLEYDGAELVGNSISTICHPSDIVPVTRELKDTTTGSPVNIVFRIRRKHSGYTWFESHGSLFVEAGKGRKCIILVGRKRPVFALSRRDLEASGGVGDSELWTKLSTSGMFLFVSSNVRSLLDLQPDGLVGTSIQELMRKESRPEFGRSIEKVRRGKIVSCKHEVQNRRGQVLQAHTTLYPGDASEGQKPTFILAQTKLLKASSRSIAPAASPISAKHGSMASTPDPKAIASINMIRKQEPADSGIVSAAAGGGLSVGNQDRALASDDNIFDELKTTRCTSWQYELRQMEKVNRVLAEELHGLLSNKKKRKRRKGVGNVVRDCANCHTRNTPEWRRGPSGNRDLCNSCGLRWAKQTGRVSPRNSSRGGNGDGTSKKSTSPVHSSPLQREMPNGKISQHASEADSMSSANRSQTSSVAPTTSAGTTPTGSKGYSNNPPLSQPLLEGGAESGQMTAIQEERVENM